MRQYCCCSELLLLVVFLACLARIAALGILVLVLYIPVKYRKRSIRRNCHVVGLSLIVWNHQLSFVHVLVCAVPCSSILHHRTEYGGFPDALLVELLLLFNQQCENCEL